MDPRTSQRVNDYIKIARPDHWFKNVTLVPGIWLAWLVFRPQDGKSAACSILAVFLSTFLVAASNYTLNELSDTDGDQRHPQRRLRPAACGKIIPLWGYAQWMGLALAGLALAWLVNRPLFLTEFLFFVMALVYNVRPLRTKDIAYVDVLSESLNNPIRFLLGWFAVNQAFLPPSSLLMAFWMLGAFFMSVKRLAELRYIHDPQTAAAYRKPFALYTQETLAAGAVFYAAAFGVFIGIFAARHFPALVVAVPLMAGFLAFYMREGLKKDSVARCPEKIYQHAFFMGYLFLMAVVVMGCLKLHWPWIKSLLP